MSSLAPNVPCSMWSEEGEPVSTGADLPLQVQDGAHRGR